MYDPEMVKYLNQGKSPCFVLKEAIKKQLRILDEQEAVERYTWSNLPNGLNAQLIERVLYYRGQGAFFCVHINNEPNFFFLPFALDGEIDIYGRYTSIRPLPFNGSTGEIKKEKNASPYEIYVTNRSLIPLYDIKLDQIKPEDLEKYCVIIKDYTEQISQTVLPRQQLQDPLLDVMSECIPYMNTALMNNTGIQGLRITTESDKQNVEIASQGVHDAALLGKKYVPLTSSFQIQELSGENVGQAEQFLMAMQSLDNYRLSLYGLNKGGIFNKQSGMTSFEQGVNQGIASLVYKDGLINRQRGCDIANSLWGLGFYCDPDESVIGMDINYDGMALDQVDQLGTPGEQKKEVM